MAHIYSKEEENFLKENVKGISLAELTIRFNKYFNLNLSESAIANRKNKLKLKSGIVGGQFQKGQVSWNKGKKMSDEQYQRCKNTMFKKGNMSNAKPIGSERITVNGYIYVKVKQPNKWVLKHRWIYEKEYGKIPKGYNLIFKDGDRTNVKLENLALLSKSELFILNQKKLYKKNKELTESGIVIVKIIDKFQKLKRRKIK